MHVIIGGAYSGKRNFVKSQTIVAEWFSAYDDKYISQEIHFVENGAIVLEGFEVWISRFIEEGKNDQEICAYFERLFAGLKVQCDVYLIMLEVGRGIVPMEANQRRLRDIMGWVQQSAVKEATTVTYIWHGLAKKMK